jgi:hypothetical protein
MTIGGRKSAMTIAFRSRNGRRPSPATATPKPPSTPAGAPDEIYDRLGDRHDAALKRLLRTPAPGLPALAAKLGLAVRHQAWELTDGDACMAALHDDAHRLAAHHKVAAG